VDVGVVRNALARGGGAPGPNQPHAHRPAQHPNAPASPAGPAGDAAPAAPKLVAPPPMEELELISLLADHPVLIATVEADKAFWLLTDDRLRAMYSAARAGQSLLELAPVQLPPSTAKHVLSGKYALAKDPASSLAELTRNLEVRKANVRRMELTKHLADARRRGDHDVARQLTQQNVALRTGNFELANQLANQLEAEINAGSRTDGSGPPAAPDTSNRKQVE